MEEVFNAFLGSGLPGAAAMALAYVVYHLWGDGKKERKEFHQLLDAAKQKHLDEVKGLYAQMRGDSEMVHKQMLDVVKQCTTVLSTTASSLDGHKDATIEHRDAAKEAAEELRKLSTLLTLLNEEIKTRFRLVR